MDNDIHPIWEAYPNLESWEDFERLADNIEFDSTVPSELVDRFERVKKLIISSRKEFELLETAYQTAIINLELALKLRFDKLGPGKSSIKNPRNLYQYLDWGSHNDLFEVSRDKIDFLRKERNKIAHADDIDTFTGILSLGMLEIIVNVINDIFDDPKLRRERKDKAEPINNLLSDNYPLGGQLLSNEDFELDFIVGRLVHYENKKEIDKPYYFLFWPYSEIKRRSSDSFETGKPLLVEAISVEKRKEDLILSISPSKKIKVTNFSDKQLNEKTDWLVDQRDHFVPIFGSILHEIGEYGQVIRGRKLFFRNT